MLTATPEKDSTIAFQVFFLDQDFMSFVRMQSIVKCIRTASLSPRPVMSIASSRFIQSGKMAIRSMSTTDGKKVDQAEPDDSGFNIFEQLKAQQQGKGNQGFEEESEMDEKEKERLKRQQESAEKEINERQARTFGVGTISMILGLVGMYAYLGMSLKFCEIDVQVFLDQKRNRLKRNHLIWLHIMGVS